MFNGVESKEFISSRHMRALEINAEYFGVSRLQLMENAGHKVALEIASRFTTEKPVLHLAPMSRI